jgi:SPX domain protein involved in polyphosphate accumulation
MTKNLCKRLVIVIENIDNTIFFKHTCPVCKSVYRSKNFDIVSDEAYRHFLIHSQDIMRVTEDGIEYLSSKVG